MSMTTSVLGFKPPNEKWKKMKTIWDACIEAGVDVPNKVEDFFGDGIPDSAGVTVDLEHLACCQVYSEEMCNGFEVDVDKLPKDVKIIRFWNSY